MDTEPPPANDGPAATDTLDVGDHPTGRLDPLPLYFGVRTFARHEAPAQEPAGLDESPVDLLAGMPLAPLL